MVFVLQGQTEHRKRRARRGNKHCDTQPELVLCVCNRFGLLSGRIFRISGVILFLSLMEPARRKAELRKKSKGTVRGSLLRVVQLLRKGGRESLVFMCFGVLGGTLVSL